MSKKPTYEELEQQVLELKYSDSDRKQAEEEIQKEKILLQTIIDNIPIMLTHYRPDADMLYLNKEFEKIVGWKTEEVQDIDMMEKVYPDPEYRKKAMEYMQNASKEWRGFEIQSKSGELILSEWSNIRMEDGTQIGIGIDITERKEADKQRQQLSQAVTQSPSIVMITDKNGQFEYVNPKFTKITGYELEELSGKTPRILKSGFFSMSEYEDLWKTVSAGKEWRGELHNKKKNGELYWVSTSISPILDEEGEITQFLAIQEDVTKRKQAEEALKESEEKFRTLFTTMEQGVVYQDATGKIISVNPAAERILGLSLDQMLGRTSMNPEWRAVGEDMVELHGDKHPAMIALKTGKIIKNFLQGIYNPVRKEYVWILVNAIPQFDKDSKTPYQVYTTFSDITERNLADEALYASSEKYKTLFNSVSDAIFTYDPETMEIVDANEATSILYGYDMDELLGMSCLKLSAEVSKSKAVASTVIKHGLANVAERHHLKKDGSDLYVELDLYHIKVNAKEHVFTICRDITERKFAEEALRQSEDRMRVLSEASFEAIFLSKKGICLDQNGTAEMMFGFTHAEAVGKPGIDWIAPEDHDLVKKNMQLGHEKPYEVTALRKDGTTFPCEIQGRMTIDQARPLRITSLRDITKRKQATEERLVLEAQLHQAHKLEAVGTMVGGISHELNNILQSIFLYSGIIEEQLPDDGNLKSNFKQLQNGAEKARDIVKQILTFSRKAGVDMKPQRIHELIMESLALERASIPANIEIKQDIDTNCGMVLCDKTQIHQIIINLCNNAEHAMKEKGGILSLSLQSAHKTVRNGDPAIDALELIIRDTGHGIEPADLESIFDPFFTTKQFGQGTGLGLSVIHGIVEMMGGHISVTSELAKGTTFSILFPVVDGVEAIHTTPKEITPKDDFNMSILLVDDDASIREVAQAILMREGFAVESASDGQKAFDLFKANPNKYNLIVTDLSMPIMSGIELCQAIRASGSDIPIMLSTGHLDIEDQQKYENIGITKSIQKPWTANELIANIQEIENE